MAAAWKLKPRRRLIADTAQIAFLDQKNQFALWPGTAAAGIFALFGVSFNLPDPRSQLFAATLLFGSQRKC